MRSPAVPVAEPVLGGVWWTVGALALPSGPGTAVLAAGLGGTGVLVTAARRRHGGGVSLPPAERARLVRIAAAAVVAVAVAAALLPLAGLGELGVPVACVLVGATLFPAASVSDERGWVLAGGVLLVLGAAGALLALHSAGALYPQGVVGMGAAVVVWLIGAHRTGLLDEVRAHR